MPFPNNTGPFKVGCIDIMTRPSTVPSSFTPEQICACDTGSFLRIFYPCFDIVGHHYKEAPWVPQPNGKLYASGFAKFLNYPRFGWAVSLYTGWFTGKCRLNPPLVDKDVWKSKQKWQGLKEEEKMPVVLFSHGVGANRMTYSLHCTELASHGLVVAAIEHRDGSASASFLINNEKPVLIPYYDSPRLDSGDPKVEKLRNVQLERRTEEVKSACDVLHKLNENPEELDHLLTTDFDYKSFKGRLDTDSFLILGHSFGAATALNALKKEPRLRAGVIFDPWFVPLAESFYDKDPDSEKPTLFLHTEHFHWRKNIARIHRYLKTLSSDCVEMVTLLHSEHEDLSDSPFVMPNIFREGDRIDYTQAMLAARALTKDYLECYFKNKGSTTFKLLGNEYTLPDLFIRGSNFTLDDELLECLNE